MTTDLWKNKTKKYFLGLTAHFFDGVLNYRNLLVGFRSFKKNHKAENIKSFIEKELQEETLDKVQINYFKFKNTHYSYFKNVSITTDNEASVKRACSALTDNCSRYSCMAHNLNLVIHRSLQLWKKTVEYVNISESKQGYIIFYLF